MRINLIKAAFLLGVTLVPATAHADDQSAQPAAKPDARAMLAAPSNGSPAEKKITNQDFTWSALTKQNAANGADPIIGAGSGKAYYDFKDGLPHPYYIAPRK